jgi:hypothetical protein
VGAQSVVIGNGQVLEADGQGLNRQSLWRQAAIAAEGVAVKIEAGWAGLRTHLPQHRGQRMVFGLSPQHRFLLLLG